MLKFIILSLLFILGFGGQSVPIPLHPDGLTLNANVNSFVLEAHYDLLCPDSRDSYFSLRNVLNATKDSVRFTIHFFPLPYHTYAHRAAIVAKVIATAYGDNTAWDFVNVFFQHQEDFYNANTHKITILEVDQKIAQFVEQNLGLDDNVILQGLADSNNDAATRVGWKLGCQRGVTGTPIYFANGIRVDDAAGFDENGWKQFLSQFGIKA